MKFKTLPYKSIKYYYKFMCHNYTQYKSNTLKVIQNSQDLTIIFNNILINKKSDLDESQNIKIILNTNIYKLIKDLNNLFRTYYHEVLRDTISKNMPSSNFH